MANWKLLSLLSLIVRYGAAFHYEDILLSDTFGEGVKGIAFSDVSGVKFGQMLSSVTVRGDERADQVTVRVASTDEATWSHGGSGGTDNILALGEGEYVNSMEIHVAKKLGSKRVFYLRLFTNRGNSVGAGSKTDESATVDAPEGYQFSGFFGRAGTEVYELGAIWTRINATHLYLTDDMGSEWYGKKMRNWKILQKAASVVSVVFNTATAGVFGEVKAAYKAAHQTYMCAASIIGVLKSLIYYLRFQQTSAPQGSVEELLAVAYQTDVVVVAQSALVSVSRFRTVHESRAS
ncbi:Jacalin-like lectin domain [Phytophthora infestans]|uniref:Jacalin-like lectin domain n=1 Tax=Phytophthora infestans TaxID=4787 RepID=A0A8S9UN23_PHYIN|nr:Jacalin-like lectin domain [Phytophthora infestans]